MMDKQNFYLHIKGSFWEFRNCRGSLLFVRSRDKYDLNQVLQASEQYCSEKLGLENPVITDYELSPVFKTDHPDLNNLPF